MMVRHPINELEKDVLPLELVQRRDVRVRLAEELDTIGHPLVVTLDMLDVPGGKGEMFRHDDMLPCLEPVCILEMERTNGVLRV